MGGKSKGGRIQTPRPEKGGKGCVLGVEAGGVGWDVVGTGSEGREGTAGLLTVERSSMRYNKPVERVSK